MQEYRSGGITEVVAMAEWETAGDARVCPDCDRLEGRKFPLDEMEGMIPLHPNCRCVALPVGVGERANERAGSRR
jgi:SPP1 gp7 family putative phage head morphogenesis protein